MNKGAGHRPDHITDRNLSRGLAQNIPAFRPPAAPHDIDALQDLHDLKQEFHGDTLALRDVLHTDGRFTVIIQRQLKNGGARILFSRGNLHSVLTDNTLDGPNLSLLPPKLGDTRRARLLEENKKAC